MRKELIFILVFVLMASVVLALDFTPQGDINLRNIYDIKNGVIANFSFYHGDGSNLTSVNFTESDPFWTANSSTVARTGNCPAGQVVQNTTTGGVQCITDQDTQYTNGSGIGLVGTQFNHSNTSSQSSSDNSGNTFIQDILLDTFGHITSIVSAAIDFDFSVFFDQNLNTTSNVTFNRVNASDWTNVTITEIQISDLSHTNDTNCSGIGSCGNVVYNLSAFDTDDLAEGSTNLYDNQSLNQTLTDSLYIAQSDEASLNVNSADFWDGLNIPTDLNNLLLLDWANITNKVPSDFNNLILSNWLNITGRPTLLSNFTDDLGDRGFTSNLNFTNDAGYYNSSKINSSELEEQGNGNLGVVDGFINSLIDNRVTQSFVRALSFYNTTETDAQIEASNDSMKIYVDNQDVIFNDSMRTYVDGTFITQANEGNLDVNRSDFWDDLDVPTDLNNLLLLDWNNITNKFITAVDEIYINMVGTTATFNETKLNQTGDARYVNIDGDTMTGDLNMSNNNIEDVSNATIIDRLFLGNLDHWIRRGAEGFNGLATESFALQHSEEHPAGTITFIVTSNKTNSVNDAVQIMAQSGLNNSGGYLGNSWMIAPNNLTTNLTDLSNCFFVINATGHTARIACDTSNTGADLFVEDDIQSGGTMFADGGIRVETLASFIMNGNDLQVQNGSVHIFTPVTFLSGVTEGQEVTVFSEKFVGGIGAFTNQQVDAGNWFATTDVLCDDGDCANSIGISGSGNIVMQTNISTININTSTLNFVYSLVNILGGNSFTVTANNNQGSGDVTILTDSTANVILSSQSIVMPSSMDNRAIVTLGFECDVTNANRECYVDTVNVNGTAIATTLTNQSGFDSVIKFSDGTLAADGFPERGIFYNASSDTIVIRGNATITEVEQQDLNVTTSITLAGDTITNWDNISSFDINVLLRDGSRALTSNWAQGAFNFTNINSWFLGKVDFSTIQNHPADLDTNASTECSGTEALLGNGTCVTPLFSFTESDPRWSGNSSTVARTGNCPAGQVVQNTTTGGVQCLSPVAVGDTNASTECSGDEVLLGNGTCLPSSSISGVADLTNVAFTNISEEFEVNLNVTGNLTVGNGTTRMDIFYNGTLNLFDTLGNNAFFTDNITADFLFGDGSQLTNLAAATDTNASTECSGTTTYLDGEGNCDDINSVYITQANEGNLNVNKSDFWDLLDTVGDILGSLINNNLGWLNQTQADLIYAPINEPLWTANFSAATGTGNVVLHTSPTFATGITVPANSISDEELDEGGTFDWTGAHTWASTGTFNDDLIFSDEIKPDNEVCNNDDILFKTGADNWDCKTVVEAGAEPISTHFDASTTVNITCFNNPSCTWYMNATDSCQYWPSGGKDCGP